VSEETEVVQRDYETEARAQGWKPQEEFGGEGWVDAKVFVERGEKYVGILKSKVDRVEEQLRYQQQVNEDFKKVIQQQTDRHKRETELLIKQLETKRSQAVTEGNGAAFAAVDAQLTEAKEALKVTPAPVAQTPQPLAPWAQEWMGENPWYGKDKAATVLAETYAKELRTAQPLLTEREFMDSVAEYVKTELPHKFENKNKRKPAPVEVDTEGGTPPSGNGKSGYNSLPAEAKSTFSRLAKEGIFKNTDEGRAKYAALYNE